MTGTRSGKALVVIALCFQAGSAAAQQTAQQYKRVRADTLRYRETTKQSTQSDMPNGPININVELSGVVALAFMRGDTARMWYDTVNAKIDSPMGDVGGDLARRLVRKPFVLRFSPSGRGTILFAPDAGVMVSRTTRTKQDSKSEMSGRATMSLPSHTQQETHIELITK